MVELLIILLCMFVGAVFGGGFASTISRTADIQAAGGVIGAIFGTVVGYFGLWFHKQQLTAPPAAKPEKTISDFRPQVVGATCATCGVRIIAISDGTLCNKCQRIHHIKCQPAMPCSQCTEIIDAVLAD